ncbi:protein-export chaperone SecB [Microvirga sp. W0021]|uniref:Protein-export protein SecB n=1 Tax=Hohaiivirga grylli TaxID=3133970 RepID=A0ABV0BF67_9HYPH
MAENPATNDTNQAAPSLNALAQYAKDFSFENPNAPRSFQTPPNNQPEISIQVNIDVAQLAEADFEVELALEGSAKVGEEVLFAFDLKYAGIFRLQGIPQENFHPVLYIECPRLLFPFGRQIVADAVRNGGFPPLYIDPIDFVELYRQKAAEAQAAAEERGNAPLSS